MRDILWASRILCCMWGICISCWSSTARYTGYGIMWYNLGGACSRGVN